MENRIKEKNDRLRLFEARISNFEKDCQKKIDAEKYNLSQNMKQIDEAKSKKAELEATISSLKHELGSLQPIKPIWVKENTAVQALGGHLVIYISPIPSKYNSGSFRLITYQNGEMNYFHKEDDQLYLRQYKNGENIEIIDLTVPQSYSFYLNGIKYRINLLECKKEKWPKSTNQGWKTQSEQFFYKVSVSNDS